MSREEYGEKFRQIQAYLHSGDCYQVNLAQRFQASYRGMSGRPSASLTAPIARRSAPLFAWRKGRIKPVAGAFYSAPARRNSDPPIKGTLPRLTDPEQDAQQAEKLANSPKDRAENLMIVDLMRNDIGRVAVPGSVRVPELFVVEPFPAVHHLVSTITARLPAHLHAATCCARPFPAARSPARRRSGDGDHR
jgi:para-aminobenzoate synthetase component 1